jgi:hypothetical protein
MKTIVGAGVGVLFPLAVMAADLEPARVVGEAPPPYVLDVKSAPAPAASRPMAYASTDKLLYVDTLFDPRPIGGGLKAAPVAAAPAVQVEERRDVDITPRRCYRLRQSVWSPGCNKAKFDAENGRGPKPVAAKAAKPEIAKNETKPAPVRVASLDPNVGLRGSFPPPAPKAKAVRSVRYTPARPVYTVPETIESQYGLVRHATAEAPVSSAPSGPMNFGMLNLGADNHGALAFDFATGQGYKLDQTFAAIWRGEGGVTWRPSNGRMREHLELLAGLGANVAGGGVYGLGGGGFEFGPGYIAPTAKGVIGAGIDRFSVELALSRTDRPAWAGSPWDSSIKLGRGWDWDSRSFF